MKHYLTAEWGRAVARPYFRAFLLVLLALAAGPLLRYCFHAGGAAAAMGVPALCMAAL